MQFHPEVGNSPQFHVMTALSQRSMIVGCGLLTQACCGPVDTAFLFDDFFKILRHIREGTGVAAFASWLRSVEELGRKEFDNHQLQAPAGDFKGGTVHVEQLLCRQVHELQKLVRSWCWDPVV